MTVSVYQEDSQIYNIPYYTQNREKWSYKNTKLTWTPHYTKCIPSAVSEPSINTHWYNGILTNHCFGSATVTYSPKPQHPLLPHPLLLQTSLLTLPVVKPLLPSLNVHCFVPNFQTYSPVPVFLLICKKIY